MYNYFEYLCCVYDICFESKSSVNRSKLALPQNSIVYEQSQFFHGVPIHFQSPYAVTTRQPLSAAGVAATHTNRSLKFYSTDWDVVPKTCNAGDWLMRYSEHETNFRPWSEDAKFSYFELVPWRQQKCRVDLINDEGCERTTLSAESQQHLRKLQKFETRRWRRLYKQRQKLDKLKTKRTIKIRFVVTFEVRNHKMKMFAPKVETRKFIYRDRHVFVFDNRCFNLDEHWGYFSQRNKGVEELLVNGQHLKILSAADYRAITDGTHHYDLPRITNGDRIFREVPCEKCRGRWVQSNN